MMEKKRFVRDNLLDQMLAEIRSMSEKLGKTQLPTLTLTNSMRSITRMCEINKYVLQRLENAIEQMRVSPVRDEAILNDLIKAAAHMQIGMGTIHAALRENIEGMTHMLDTMKNSITLDEKLSFFKEVVDEQMPSERDDIK